MTHLVHRRHMRRIVATCLILTIMTGSINAFRHRQCNSKMMCAGTQLTIRKSIAVLYSTELSNDVKVETTAIDSIRELPPNPILERVQKGLARLTENIPRPVLITVVAVASGLLFFELSKALLILALPIIAVLGKKCAHTATLGYYLKPVFCGANDFRTIITSHPVDEMYCMLLVSSMTIGNMNK
jgi:hypothetical protein